MNRTMKAQNENLLDNFHAFDSAVECYRSLQKDSYKWCKKFS